MSSDGDPGFTSDEDLRKSTVGDLRPHHAGDRPDAAIPGLAAVP
jgi:hypothetical protein